MALRIIKGLQGAVAVNNPTIDPDTQEKLMRRAKALLARTKAGSGVTQAEFEQAQAITASIARQMGLELYELEKRLSGEGKAGFAAMYLDIDGKAHWRRDLARCLCSALIIEVLYDRVMKVSAKPNKRSGNDTRSHFAPYVTVVGMPQDLEVLDYLFGYLSREIERRARLAYRADQLKASISEGMVLAPKAYYDDFARGAIAALGTRVKALFRAETKPEEGGLTSEQMALVPLKQADVQDASKQFFPSQHTIKQKLGQKSNKLGGMPGTIDSDWVEQLRTSAMTDGYRAGQDMDIRKGLRDREVVGAIEGR